MRRLFGSISRALAPLLRDGAGLAGCGLISYGVWCIYEPAGFIVAGVLLVGASLLLSLKAKPE